VARRSIVVRLVLGGGGLAYGLSGAVFGWGQASDRLGGPVVLALTAAVTGTGFVAVVMRRWPRLHPALLTLVTLGAVGMQVVSPYSGLGFAYVVAWLAVFSVPLSMVVVLGVIDAAGIGLASGFTDLPAGATIGITIGLLFNFAFAVAIRQLVLIRERTEAVAVARAEAAVLAERQRLAREMHDVLAHSLSAQTLHLEGARLLLERGGSTEQILHHVRRAIMLARAGLVETKQALQALRGEDLDVAGRLASLAGEFRSATGLSCDLSIEGDCGSLSAEAGLAVVRTAQEALTNIRTHAPGAASTVRFTCAGGWCELVIDDPGPPHGAGRANGHPPAPAPGAGYGLVGMQERAELLGGTMVAGPHGAGFRVRLRLPLTGAAAVIVGMS
jgi:signal transduction histidine kinase